MKRLFLFATLFVISSILFSNLVSDLWPQQVYAQFNPSLTQMSNPIKDTKATCLQPAAHNQQFCAAQEQQILASVMRIVLHGEFGKGQHSDFRGSVGHATVVNGRYLITHNHYSIDLTTLSPTNTQGLAGFSLYNAAGQVILRHASVDNFQASVLNPQTLVLDFGANYFDNLKITSAPFEAFADANMIAGAEVAQIDWDGRRAYVIWTTVTEVIQNHSSPHLVLDNYVMAGSSGGGVFWNGHHIANNWAVVTIKGDGSGDFLSAVSLAALNSDMITQNDALKTGSQDAPER